MISRNALLDQTPGEELQHHQSLRHLSPQSASGTISMSATQLRIHRCLCWLFGILIFEGLIRKLAPSSLGILIFFFKDFLTLYLLFMCLKMKTNAVAHRWLSIMRLLFVFVLPCILFTAIQSPVLAVFGAKQYLLFPAVAVAMCAAYLPDNRRKFFSLFRWIALSVIVTTLVAVAQNRLPASNWLNLSVGGEDLSAFSAGGYLRVSSTFAFVGQYCYYLNALCYCLPVLLFYKESRSGIAAPIGKLALIGLFIIGMFVTGSRLAVVGNLGILCIGGMLLVLFGGPRAWGKILIPIVIGVSLLSLLESQYPEFFTAYQIRSKGTEEASHATLIKDRIEYGLLDWTSGSDEAPPSLFGYGLGVMSNGSDKLSSYAAGWRDSGFWTESDQATTLFEGGWYLIVIWYGFRGWVIVHSLILVLKLRRTEYRMIASFGWGFVAIIGTMGTLAIQPPLAIWWWLAAGLIICISQYDRAQQSREKPARVF